MPSAIIKVPETLHNIALRQSLSETDHAANICKLKPLIATGGLIMQRFKNITYCRKAVYIYIHICVDT